jgi:hypothetical protein
MQFLLNMSNLNKKRIQWLTILGFTFSNTGQVKLVFSLKKIASLFNDIIHSYCDDRCV